MLIVISTNKTNNISNIAIIIIFGSLGAWRQQQWSFKVLLMLRHVAKIDHI